MGDWKDGADLDLVSQGAKARKKHADEGLAVAVRLLRGNKSETREKVRFFLNGESSGQA